MKVGKRWKGREWADAFLSFLFPRCCLVCGAPLTADEDLLCLACNVDLPRTGYHRYAGNPVEQRFWGKVPVERATSFFFYRKGSRFKEILHGLKYRGEKEIGAVMGRMMAAELQSSGFFAGIDAIVPVPLHPQKQKRRGYNQSEWIGKGISEVTGIPVVTTLVHRRKDTDTQTRKSTFDRWANVEGIFELDNGEEFRGKHLLLIDDVLTTGATLVACATALAAIPGVRLSYLTLAEAE